jgi:hypothetical protein
MVNEQGEDGGRKRRVSDLIDTGMNYFDQIQGASPEEVPGIFAEGHRAIGEVGSRRPRCPFYGLHSAQGALIDTSRNQCALIIESYSPCQMEVDGQTPYWETCPLNTPQLRETIANKEDEVRVFPNELRP